mgnify:CR=1 FL=1
MTNNEIREGEERGLEDMTSDEIKAKLIEIETELHQDLSNPLSSRMDKEHEKSLIDQRHQLQETFRNLTGKDFGANIDDYPDSIFSDKSEK